MQIGPLEVWPPVVLAPMAGVTNPAFRRLCRRFGAGLYVSEMVNARGLIEGGAKSWELAAFDADESPRSIQLYGTDPVAVAGAVERLVTEAGVDHVDLNFGCPVRKVTRHGGGSAVPVRPRLLAAIVRAAVGASGADGRPVPVTVKMRLGIDDELLTYLDAGRVAEDEGAAAVALHARTAAQLYSGQADWSAIGRLKEHVSIPVLGNGDIWRSDDALAMLRHHRRGRRGRRPRLPGPTVAVPRPGRRVRRPPGAARARTGRGRRHHGRARRAAGRSAG